MNTIRVETPPGALQPLKIPNVFSLGVCCELCPKKEIQSHSLHRDHFPKMLPLAFEESRSRAHTTQLTRIPSDVSHDLPPQ